MNQSSARLEAWLADDQSSPSQKAQHKEDVLLLATAVEKLPNAQREAIELHFWQNRTLDEIGEHLDRSSSAVAGLLRRGLKTLKDDLRLQRDSGL